MRCCVPSCNSSKNTQKVTFHKFPKERFCRAAWFAALGIEESDANDALVACSLHFKDCNFYNGKNGSRVLQRGAVPFVQVCMICLDTNCKLYPLSKYNLEQAYESLTGLQLQQAVPCLTPAVCSECAHRLTNNSQFRHKSLRSHILLLELYKQHELLTVPSIKTINRLEHGLISKITQKLFKPNHSDLSVVDDSVDIEDAEKKSIVKLENQAEVLIAYEPKDKYLNESQGNDFTELGLHGIKTDFECDIDIDVDHIYDENDSDFSNNENDDGIPNDKKVDVVTKIENDNESPLLIENVVEKTRNVQTANKTVRKKPPARKRNVTKKDVGPKPKRKRIRPPKVIPGIIKTIRKSRERLTIFETTKLSFEEQVEEIHKRKETSNYKNSSFRCDMCFRGFISEITYTRHMEKHSNVNGSLVCPVCKQCVKEKHALHKHSKAHETRYSCTLCEFQTMISESARMHEQWHKGTKFKCQHCDAEFLKSTSYMTHLRVKHPSDHICNQCGYSYLSDMGLRAHLRRIHRSDKVESPLGPQCAECDVRFVTAEAYERHLRVSPKHSTPETREVNQPVPRRCYSKWPQKTRAPGEPLGEDAITCEQCGMKLKDYSRYSFHFKRVHPDKNRTQYAPSKRAVLCELCGKSFQSPHHLKYHMAKHTGEKNFRCDVCDRRFRIKAFLDKHKETHMDKAARRLYTCAVCDKGFTCPSSLNRHVWIHRGKSFKCEYCEKAFSNASERNCHVSHVHMKVPWPKRQRGPNRARPPSVTKDDSYDE